MLKKKSIPVQVVAVPPSHSEEIAMPFSLIRQPASAWAQPAGAT